MRAYRILGMLIAAATAVLLGPTAAHAEPYPAEPPASSVSEATVADGGSVVFSGQGFLPGETIAIQVSYETSDSTAAYDGGGSNGFVLAALPRMKAFEVTASEGGTFRTEIQLTRVGTATLQATGVTSGVTVTAIVQVAAIDDSDNSSDGDDTTANGGGALPTTGMSGRLLAIAAYGGGGLLLGGVALVWFARNRRRGLTQ